MKKQKQPKKTKYTWTNRNYWLCYRLAMEGMSDIQIAAVLQVTPSVFQIWKKKRPSLRDGLQEAREERQALRNNLSGYIFDRLSPESRAVWDRLITAWEDEDEASRERKLRAVLDGHEESTYKHLFLHSVANCGFDFSQAMKQVGVSSKQVKKWAATDREFMEALEEIEEHKKNFYESKLVKLVEKNDPAAILFVNRTYNADRGYTTKQQVEINSTVNHVHSGQVTLEAIARYLPVDVLDQVHRAVQMLRAAPAEGSGPKALPPADDVIEAEVIEPGDIVAGSEKDE